MALWPRWAWMGLLDGAAHPLLSAAAVLGYPVLGISGFAVGAVLLRGGRRSPVRFLLGAALVALLVVSVLGFAPFVSILSAPDVIAWAWVMVAGVLSAGGTFVYALVGNLRWGTGGR